MADGDIGAEELQAKHRKGKGKKERNGKDEEMKLFATLYEDTACFGDEGDKRKWLTVKSVHKCLRNIASRLTILEFSEITIDDGDENEEKLFPDCLLRNPRLVTGEAEHFCLPQIYPPRKHNKKQCFCNNVSWFS